MKWTLMLVVFAAPLAAWAHDEHCHTKDDAGNLVDAKDFKDKKTCEAKGGTWLHHHAHCHKADASGKLTDLPAAKTEKDCSAKGGTWSDHGHEAAATADGGAAPAKSK